MNILEASGDKKDYNLLAQVCFSFLTQKVFFNPLSWNLVSFTLLHDLCSYDVILTNSFQTKEANSRVSLVTFMLSLFHNPNVLYLKLYKPS